MDVCVAGNPAELTVAGPEPTTFLRDNTCHH